ncbi:universal stress protein [Cryobacterium frigoriphilum]|uniref:Universal stress protein n=2 Tax=Cryobacterium frigoriphilum TaxID=1259150 RepID=A0A4R8ZVD8_9MICO|nr:universal stress protein [Cryobacterium frigoriphilum]
MNNSDLVPAPSESIVVGHDGSAGADTALAVALELADELYVPIVLVRAWSITTAPRPSVWEFGYVSSLEEYEAAVHDELEQDSRALIERFPLVSIFYRPVYAAPAQALIALSHDARLLVVGTRGRGDFAGMLLGSVSRQCLRHAACLVLVVPPRP